MPFPPETTMRRSKPLGSQPGYQHKPLATSEATGAAGAALATQTTLAAVLAKMLAAPSTEAKQDTANTLLTSLTGYLDGVESALFTANGHLANIKTNTDRIP